MRGVTRRSASAASRLHLSAQHGAQAGPPDGQYGGYVGIGRDDNFVAFLHLPHYPIGQEDEGERIKTVAYAHAVVRAAEAGKVLLEAFGRLAAQVPARVQHALHSLPKLRLEGLADAPQVQVEYLIIRVRLHSMFVLCC